MKIDTPPFDYEVDSEIISAMSKCPGSCSGHEVLVNAVLAALSRRIIRLENELEYIRSNKPISQC
jgi:hypothetical protein